MIQVFSCDVHSFCIVAVAAPCSFARTLVNYIPVSTAKIKIRAFRRGNYTVHIASPYVY